MTEETPNVTPPPSATEWVPDYLPNYLWQSIVVTILCCVPLGIPAIIFASKVNGLVLAEQFAEAKEASAKAKMWCWISFGVGLVIGIVTLVINIFADTATVFH